MKILPINDWRVEDMVDGAQLIDVRELDEFAAGHLPGAQPLPLSSLSETTVRLDKGQPCYVVCQKGTRSARAGQWLDEQGYQVITLAGGLDIWQGELVQTVAVPSSES